jgi:hypothetical protein
MKKPLFLALVCSASIGSVLGQTVTVVPNSTTYSSSGGQISFTVSLSYPANASAVSFSAKPPTGSWAYVATGGANVPAVSPHSGDTTNPDDALSVFGWTYTSVPAGSASFTFVLSHPAGLSGDQVITFAADYRLDNTLTPMSAPPITLTIATTPEEAPAIVTHPANVTVPAGENADFTVGVTGSPAPAIRWQRSTDGGGSFVDLSDGLGISGAETATLTLATTAGMNGHRFQAIASNGIGADATSNTATLTVTQVPVITTQPADQATVAGGSATFVASATGSAPLTYQWYFTPANGQTPQALSNISGKISGAQSASLTVVNVQSADTGDYVCVVTNDVGDATSNPAQLTIVPRLVRIVNQSAAPGTNVVVAMQLLASGDENALGFSVNFDVSQLTFQSAAQGAQATDVTLNTNSSQAASGQVGFALAKPTEVVWSTGTQEIVKITFAVSPDATDGAQISLMFGDQPITREVSTATAQVLTAAYQAGVLTISSGYEADMNGDGRVSITDWVKVGRIVAGLDPVEAGIEFMKADCAPRLNADGSLRLGDGRLTITDWVLAGRYAAGLEPLTPAGGPSSPIQ